MDSGLSRRASRLKQYWRQFVIKRQERWLDRRAPSEPVLKLGQRSIFILPTFQGALFGIGATVVLVIAVAERNPFSVVLAAMLLSLFLLSLVLCYRNLSGLELTASDGNLYDLPNARCFAGQNAQYSVNITPEGSRRSHRDIWIGFSRDELQPISVTAGKDTTVHLSAVTSSRGIFQAPRMLLRTRYPVGLWQSWSRPQLDMRYLVYPRPIACELPAWRGNAPDTSQGSQVVLRKAGVDDFYGLRTYSPGDGGRRIAWQSLARGQGLKTKQFVSEEDAPVLLSLAMFPNHETEEALSCLSYLVVKLLSCHEQKVGMLLPGFSQLQPDKGEIHKHRLLQALAIWE